MNLIGGLSPIELKTLIEDDVRAAMEDWSELKLNIAYKYLQALCCHSASIDARIATLLHKEWKKGNGGSQ